MIRVRLKSFISGYLIYLQNIRGLDVENSPHLVHYKYKVIKKIRGEYEFRAFFVNKGGNFVRKSKKWRKGIKKGI